MKQFINDLMSEKGRIRSLTKYVVFSITILLVFTAIALVYQFITGNEVSPTLITCFFSCFGGEILLSALIKIFKIKRENNYFEPFNNTDEMNNL